MSNSLWSYGLQHARLPSLSIINSKTLLKLMPIESVMPCDHLILCCPLLLLPSIFLTIRIFSNKSVLHNRWSKYWNFSIVLSVSIQDWFPLGLTGLISLQSKGLSRVFTNTTVQKHHFFGTCFFNGPTVTSKRNYWKNHSSDYMELLGKIMSLIFNIYHYNY